MSTPKRATKTTTPKATLKKTAAKAPSKKSVKPAAKTAKTSLKTKAQKVAKKVAKIISKIVAKKKSAAKKSVAEKPAAPIAKTAVKKVAKKSAVKSSTKSSVKAAGKAIGKALTTAAGQVKRSVTRKQAAKPKAGKTADGVVTKGTKTTVVKPLPKTAVPARRPKVFAPRDVERAFGFPADTPELPERYGEDRLVLMTKDPEYLFAYWELTPEKMATAEKIKRRGEDYREALRLNWDSRDIFERNFAVMPVTLNARKWYLRVPFSGLAYQVEIGWLGESGHFISLLTSNPSDAPESWNATKRRIKAAGVTSGAVTRTLATGRPQGSSDQSPFASTTSATSSLTDWGFTGPGTQTSSSGPVKKPRRRAKS
jgi:hypothetical protein